MARPTETVSGDVDPKTGNRPLHYRWVIVASLFVIWFVAYGMRFSFGVFFKPLQEYFEWGRATTSTVFSLYMAFCAVFTILGGWALDRFGAKRVFVLAGFFAGLSFLLTSRVTASWQLFITYSLFLAMGTAPIYVMSMSTVSRWFTQRRGMALGIVTAGSSLGMIFVSPISAYLIAGYGWQRSYFFLSLAVFLVMIPCAFLLKEPPASTAIFPTDPAGERKNSEPVDLSLSQAIRIRSFWLIMFMLLLVSTGSYIVLTHVVPHAIDLGLSPIKAASMLSFIGIGTLVGRLIMGRISDSMGSKGGMLICALLLGAAMFWLLGSSKLWMLYLFTIVFGFGFGATAPLNAALIGDSFGLRHVGLIMGVIEIGWELGAACGPAVAGYVFDVVGSYSYAFLGGGVAALLAAVLIQLTPRPKPGA